MSTDEYVTLVTPFLAPLYIGMVFSTTLHVSILQAGYYYTHCQSDKWHLKSLVAAVVVSNTIHEAIIVHTVYMYGVAYWGNMTKYLTLVWSLVIQALFGGLTTFLVQSFLVIRLWRLSNHNIFLLTFASLIVLSQLVSAFILSIVSVERKSLLQLIELRPWSCAVIALTAVGDVIIAVALCILLHRSRTGWRRSDSIINKLIAFTINTGLISSLYAVISLIAYLAASDTSLYVAFYFSVGRLYTNALLATLNARKKRSAEDNIHNFDTCTDAIGTLSLRGLSNPGNSLIGPFPTQQSDIPNMSINVDTTKEIVTDLVHDEEQPHDKDKIETSKIDKDKDW